MARRRRFRTTRRRRSSPCDIIPLTIPNGTLAVHPGEEGGNPPPDFVTPERYLFPICDGTAFNDLLLAAARSASGADTDAYYDAQGQTRGLSWLGANFKLIFSINDSISNFVTGAPLVADIRIAWGLMRYEWGFTPIIDTGTPGAGTFAAKELPEIPNLFSRDERFLQDVFLRDEMLLGPIWTPFNSDPNVASYICYRDTTGGALDYLQTTGAGYINNQFVVNTGPACSNQTHFRTKSRRRVDETHAIGLVINIAPTFELSDVMTIGFTLHGLQKVKSGKR